MRLKLVGLIVIAALAGCAKPLEVSSITEIKSGPGANGLDVYAGRRASGETVPEFSGEQILDIRTFTTSDDNQMASQEFAGAQCEVKASNFIAEMVSPAKVRVPLYRDATSPLSVSCRMDGFQPKLVTTTVVNATRNDRYAMGANAGVIGLAVALTADAIADAKQDTYKYQPVRVEMSRTVTAPQKVAAAKDAR